jgi:hypothetical protein
MKKEETPYTEMKQFTDEKKGNSLYRDERVH